VFRRIFAVLTLFIGLTILTAPLARSQSGDAAPRFEVSSIRHCAPGGQSGVPPPAPGRISVNCISVMTLIRQSYILFANGTMNLLPVKVVSLEKIPGWINSDLYTIEASVERIAFDQPIIDHASSVLNHIEAYFAWILCFRPEL
jgi:hypothetical protein